MVTRQKTSRPKPKTSKSRSKTSPDGGLYERQEAALIASLASVKGVGSALQSIRSDPGSLFLVTRAGPSVRVTIKSSAPMTRSKFDQIEPGIWQWTGKVSAQSKHESKPEPHQKTKANPSSKNSKRYVIVQRTDGCVIHDSATGRDIDGCSGKRECQSVADRMNRIHELTLAVEK